MRFNFFTSSLIVALSAAISMEAADLDDNELVAAQVDASVEWTSDGRHKSKYKRPQDHCCWLYVDGNKNAGGFKTAYKELCWNKTPSEGGSSGVEHNADKTITGIDCGKNTWLELLNDNARKFHNFVGRTVYDLKK